MENIPEFKKPESEEERIDREVREKINKIRDSKDFTLKDKPRSQEEIQAAWEEQKKQQSQKFNPEHLEQGDLFI